MLVAVVAWISFGLGLGAQAFLDCLWSKNWILGLVAYLLESLMGPMNLLIQTSICPGCGHPACFLFLGRPIFWTNGHRPEKDDAS